MNGKKTDFHDRSPEPFLLLDENRFAHAALGRLSDGLPRGNDALVYIYGPSGVGKSHLVRQFRRDVQCGQPPARVLHVTAAELADRLTTAVQQNALDDLRQANGGIDVLICEDMQALQRRHEMQRQLVSLVDDVLAADGRVVLTCHKSPGGFGRALSRLVNRCHSGVCAPVGLPSRASRVLLLRHFANARRLPLLDEVIELLASRLAVSPRELSAALVQLEAALCVGRQSAITIQSVSRLLGDDASPQPLSISRISRAVAGFFGVRLADIRSRSRIHSLALPRQCAMYLARELSDTSLSKIGRYFGRSNHSCVAHACVRIRTLLPQDPQLRQQLLQIHESLVPAASSQSPVSESR